MEQLSYNLKIMSVLACVPSMCKKQTILLHRSRYDVLLLLSDECC
jgi:hypothetical protein